MPMRELSTITQGYTRTAIFPVRAVAKGSRGKKYAPTSEVQRKLNDRNAEYKLSDQIHTNFYPYDYTVELTYADGCLPDDPAAAKREFVRLINRLRYSYKKAGIPVSELKYIYTTEMSSTGRIHHHCFISGHLPASEIKRCWRAGHCHIENIEFDENGVRGKAHYLLKDRITYRRWSCSKNLNPPQARQNDYRISLSDAKYINENPTDTEFIESLYPGWSVAEVQTTANPSQSICPFIILHLYKSDNEYFRRTSRGIDYTYRPAAGSHKALTKNKKTTLT